MSAETACRRTNPSPGFPVEALDKHHRAAIRQPHEIGRRHIEARAAREFQAGPLHDRHVEAVVPGRKFGQVLLPAMDDQGLGPRPAHGAAREDRLQLRGDGQALLDALDSLHQVVQLGNWRQEAGRFGAVHGRPEVEGTETMGAGMEQIDGLGHRVGRHLEPRLDHAPSPEVRSGIAHRSEERRMERLIGRLVARQAGKRQTLRIDRHGMGPGQIPASVAEAAGGGIRPRFLEDEPARRDGFELTRQIDEEVAFPAHGDQKSKASRLAALGRARRRTASARG